MIAAWMLVFCDWATFTSTRSTRWLRSLSFFLIISLMHCPWGDLNNVITEMYGAGSCVAAHFIIYIKFYLNYIN